MALAMHVTSLSLSSPLCQFVVRVELVVIVITVMLVLRSLSSWSVNHFVTLSNHCCRCHCASLRLRGTCHLCHLIIIVVTMLVMVMVVETLKVAGLKQQGWWAWVSPPFVMVEEEVVVPVEVVRLMVVVEGWWTWASPPFV